jgi:hypothetical protein
MCRICADLLSEGLDLCIRARRLDAQDRTNTAAEASSDPDWWTPENTARHAARANALWPGQPMATRCATIPLWVADQYERDLADWERRSRHHLQQNVHS